MVRGLRGAPGAIKLRGIMAIFGSISTVRVQTAGQPGLQKALDYVDKLLRNDSPERVRMFALPAGKSVRTELGGGMFAGDAAYLSKPRPDCFFESHRKYIDVQVVLEGEEVIELEDISRLTVSQPYLEERDVIKYADTPAASRLVLRAGDAAILYPVDGHLPSLQLGDSRVLVRKTVVKVPVG